MDWVFLLLTVSKPHRFSDTPIQLLLFQNLTGKPLFSQKISTAHIVNFVICLLNYVQKGHRKLSAERN